MGLVEPKVPLIRGEWAKISMLLSPLIRGFLTVNTWVREGRDVVEWHWGQTSIQPESEFKIF